MILLLFILVFVVAAAGLVADRLCKNRPGWSDFLIRMTISSTRLIPAIVLASTSLFPNGAFQLAWLESTTESAANQHEFQTLEQNDINALIESTHHHKSKVNRTTPEEFGEKSTKVAGKTPGSKLTGDFQTSNAKKPVPSPSDKQQALPPNLLTRNSLSLPRFWTQRSPFRE